jgi:serine/threonine protein kinase
MERNICISRLRDNLDFPPDWDASVAKAFPTLRDLIVSMLAKNGEQRPKAEEVAHHVQDLLGELTIISVTKDQTADKDLILLRVEADSEADTLPTTMDEIRQAAQPGSVDILQYGMSQTKDSHIIMEFALRSSPGVDGGNLVLKLKQRPKILMARQVSVPQ